MHKRLGEWVGEQRSYHTLKLRGVETKLTDSRVFMLESIGFQWNGADTNHQADVGPLNNERSEDTEDNNDQQSHPVAIKREEDEYQEETMAVKQEKQPTMVKQEWDSEEDEVQVMSAEEFRLYAIASVPIGLYAQHS
jgi:hypothetical protein